jgi:hypothetical protein
MTNNDKTILSTVSDVLSSVEPQVASALAARSALRSLPLGFSGSRENGLSDMVLLNVLRYRPKYCSGRVSKYVGIITSIRSSLRGKGPRSFASVARIPCRISWIWQSNQGL